MPLAEFDSPPSTLIAMCSSGCSNADDFARHHTLTLMIPLRGYATYKREVAPVKSNTCCSSGPHFRVTKHHLGWTIHIIRNNANLTLAVGAVAHTSDFLMIHIQLDGTAAGDHCHQVGLIQASVDGRT